MQDDALATYANKISKAEAQLDWRRPAAELDLAVRAFNPFPVCYTLLDGERVRVWQATPVPGESGEPGTIARATGDGIAVNCGRGQLLLQTLQLPGGKALSAAQVLAARSDQFAPGTRFDLPDNGAA